MPFLDSGNNFTVDTLAAVTAAAANGTTTGSEGYGPGRAMVAQLDVTAAVATGTLDVVIEDTVDGTNWHTVATFPQTAAVSVAAQRINTPFTNRLRVRYTVGGTAPSFDFTVKAYIEKAHY